MLTPSFTTGAIQQDFASGIKELGTFELPSFPPKTDLSIELY